MNQCTSAFPWAGQFAQLPLSTDSGYSPMIPFAIDGTKFKATLDTGAVKTLIAARSLANKAVKPTATVSGETSIGIGGLAAPVAVERFATVTIGGEVFGPSWLRVAASPGAMDETDALLGEDYIRDHQIYIANDTGAVFLGTRIIPVP